MNNPNLKRYDLEERTYIFARDCRYLVSKISLASSSFADGRQLARSSGSVAANYIEANEALSKKDFTHRIKICKKEAKESKLWIRLIESLDKEKKLKFEELKDEAIQLTKIFGAILEKTKKI